MPEIPEEARLTNNVIEELSRYDLADAAAEKAYAAGQDSRDKLISDCVESTQRQFTHTEKRHKVEIETERAKAAALVEALGQYEEAMYFTREYVGEELLPAIPGWSWFDAVVSGAAALAAYKEQADGNYH